MVTMVIGTCWNVTLYIRYLSCYVTEARGFQT